MTKPGVVIADRFELERLARASGATTMFQARDRQTGRPVAIKIFAPAPAGPQRERFAQEVGILAEFGHPGLPAYVAHGQMAVGKQFLVTEWLSGESLPARQARQRLSVAESLLLARRVAETLAFLHGHGATHREVKPSKLFLCDGRIEQVVLLDFAVPRRNLALRTVTGSGVLIDTMHYLAPEQVRGEGALGPSVDVYALGCVLYECLTGTPPLAAAGGTSVSAALMRILYEEAPRLRQLRPELPEALEELLARMLAKQPGARMQDGRALADALAALPVSQEELETVPAPAPVATLGTGRRLVCTIVARAAREPGNEDDAARDAPPDLEALQHLLTPYQATVDQRWDGTITATLAHAGSETLGRTATDLAVQAARAARKLAQALPGWAMALVTGPGGQGPAEPRLAGAMEQAEELLAHAATGGQEPPLPWLDELTAGLLDTRYHVRRVEAGRFVLEQERGGEDEVRPLLGRALPCVGREQELQLLDSLLERCAEDMTAQVVLVLAPSGTGKSRLRHEFVRRQLARAEADGGQAWEIWLGTGDPMRASTGGGLLAEVLLRLCEGPAGVSEPEPVAPAERRRSFSARIGRHLGETERQRVVEFLGELCGLDFPDEGHPELRAARQEPRLMSERITAAFVALLRAECDAHPVLLILEDLHWGDAVTVQLVDAALRELKERPLLVLALGRPEMKELFPRLWESHRLQELRLSGIGRRASELLIKQALGERATPAVVSRLIEQANGNALFLEELIRAVAEGVAELPATLLAMLQARFLRLEPGVRRLLGAASILGETFWHGGLVELLGTAGRHDRAPRDIARWLEILIAAETIVRHARSRYAGETEYAFRHVLMRDAAYSLLTEEDRRLGHARAGAYLERMGERDGTLLAQHFERGGEGERAARYWMRIAAETLAESDIQGALRAVERGVACGAQGEMLGALRATEAWAHLWNSNVFASHAAGQEALRLLPPGALDWYRALGTEIAVNGTFGQRAALLELVRALEAAPARPGTEHVALEALVAGLVQVSLAGMREETASLLRRAEEICDPGGRRESRSLGQLRIADAMSRLLFTGDPEPSWSAEQDAMALFVAAGEQRFVASTRGFEGLLHLFLGERAALAGPEESVATLERLQEPALRMVMQLYLAFVMAEVGTPEQLPQAEKLALEILGMLPPNILSGLAHAAVAQARLRQGQQAGAEQVARWALAATADVPEGRILACGLLGRALLEQGRLAEARAVVEEGYERLQALGGRCILDVRLYLVVAEVRHAQGAAEEARAALAQAVQHIERRAAQIEDATRRERFLREAPEHARIRELWARWQVAL
ncbi:MAG TPA: AAA family ATPase [Polyangia bacterium]|nr:AAA family ATPase [Polyangia bacterium]